MMESNSDQIIVIHDRLKEEWQITDKHEASCKKASRIKRLVVAMHAVVAKRQRCRGRLCRLQQTQPSGSLVMRAVIAKVTYL